MTKATQNLTELVFILDRSGSMTNNLTSDTIGGAIRNVHDFVV